MPEVPQRARKMLLVVPSVVLRARLVALLPVAQLLLEVPLPLLEAQPHVQRAPQAVQPMAQRT